MMREAVFMAKAKWFPWSLPEKVRFAIGFVGLVWAGMMLLALGTILGADSMGAHLWEPRMWVSMTMNVLLVSAAVWQMPYRACKHCGKRRNEPLEVN